MKSTQRKAGRTLRKRLRPAPAANVVAAAVKKRGRRPRLLRELEDNWSPTETTDEEEEEEEEGGEEEDNYQEEEEEEEEPLTDTDGTGSEAASATASRRSQRARPLDLDKPLVVILPDDDVAEVLGISEEEAAEWLFDFAHEDCEPKAKSSRKGGKHKAQDTGHDENSVAIPGVHKISGKAAAGTHGRGNFKLPTAMLQSSTVITGTEYDLDSDDERFLKDLQVHGKKKPARNDHGKKTSTSSSEALPPRVFERMIEVLERELHLARSRQFSRSDIEESKRCQEDVADSAHQLVAGIESFLTADDAAALQRAIDDNQRRPSMAVREDPAKAADDSAAAPRPIGRPPGNVRRSSDAEDMYNKWRSTSIASKALSPVELERMVPEAEALELLRSVFEDESASAATPPSDAILQAVYRYWKARICASCTSRLRCFHEFIMENWTRFGTMPFVPDDSDNDALVQAYSKLQAVRFDLERVRLMLDVVRKREKLKREIIRQTNVAADALVRSSKRTRDDLDSCSYQLPEFQEEELSGSSEEGEDDEESDESKGDEEEEEERSGPRSGKRAASAATGAAMLAKDKGKGRGRGRVAGTPGATTSTSGWSEEEDRALLIAVARHGIGRWTQIRQDLNFTQTSAQMSQRFSRLARHRMKFIGKTEKGEAPAEVYHTKKAKPSWLKSLSPDLLEQIENFDAATVWERIAQRHLEDQRSCQKRSGRPVKYPVVIPVPDHVMKRLQANLAAKSGPRPTHSTHMKRTAPKGSEGVQSAPRKRPRHSVVSAQPAQPAEKASHKSTPAPRLRTLRSHAS